MPRTRMAINGFGRMGRLALRAAWGWPDVEFVHVNELHGDAATAAHLLTFDSVHGRWNRAVESDGDALVVDGTRIAFTQHGAPAEADWDVDLVLECTGQFRTPEKLQPYFDRGVRKVVVAAPVKDDRAVNIVVGVNDDRY